MGTIRREILRRGLTLTEGALLALALAFVTGCGEADSRPSRTETAGPRRGGVAVLGRISDVDAWNEYVSQQSFAVSLLRRIFLPLARETGAGNAGPEAFEPVLAESWEPSADRLQLTFRLRQASWSDGVPLTADDVRFTWEAQTSEEVPWIGAETKRRITDVEVVDARTVRFHYEAPYPYQFADAVEGGIVPRHVFGDVPFGEWVTHDWSSYAIGSGPFVLARHVPLQEIELVRNDRYYREAYPLLDRVVVRIVADDLSLLTQLETGQLDYLEGIPPRDAHRMERASGSRVTLIDFDHPKYDFIGWNGSRPPFDDPTVRLALTLAIDREALVEDLLYGYGRVAKGPVPSFWWGADESIRPWPHDPARARELLAERGLASRGPDGAMGPGLQLKFELITNSGNQLREDMLVKVQEQLARLGIAVSVRPLEMKTLREQVTSGNYDAYLGGWSFMGKIDLAQLFGSQSIPPRRGLNIVHYRSREVDELLEQLTRCEQWREMAAPLAGIQRRIHEDQPYTFLYETRRIAGHGPRLRGVVIDVPSDPLARLDRFWVVER